MSVAHAAGHVMRRGVEVAQAHFQQVASPEYIARLQQEAELYEQAGPDAELTPAQFFPVMITAFIALLILGSIRYTVGDVIASLAMIESPTTTAIIEPKPPAYADEPDAPLEKEPLMPSEAEADVEVTLINHKPMTGKIRASVRHLNNVGGFFAKWRGLGWSWVYHALHAFFFNALTMLLGIRFNVIGNVLAYIFVSVSLARLHMVWTQRMISMPARSTPLLRRGMGKKQHKALLLPAAVYAAAEQAVFYLPLGVAYALGLHDENQALESMREMDCSKMGFIALKVLAVPLTALFVAFAVLLPASVTLTRIEAALLPEDVEPIVPFDREAIMGDIDTSVRGGCKSLFVQAWRSFDAAARIRLIKLYIKMILLQIAVAFIAIHVVFAEIYMIGGEKLGLLIKSGVAQLKLMAIEAQQEAIDNAAQ